MEIVPFGPQYDVEGFTCGQSDDPDVQDEFTHLDAFLHDDASKYAENSIGRTYLAVEGNTVAGYITLLMDSIWIDKSEKPKLESVGLPPLKTIPALKVGRLARNVSFRGKYLGLILMRHAFDVLVATSDKVGCRFLTVDAIPSALPFYKRLAFEENVHNNHKPKSGRPVSMRFDAFAPELPDWTK